jgi:nicotinamidase-related amidase
MKNLGIMLIDMQETFIGKTISSENKHLVNTQIELLGFAQEEKIPVFVIEWTGMGRTIQPLKERILMNRNYFLEKCNCDGFSYFNEDKSKQLLEVLTREGIKNLILTGVSKNACVLATAEGAKKKGYNIFTSDELMDFGDYKSEWYLSNSNHYNNFEELIKISKK